MEYLKTNNPREFYKIFSKSRRKNNSSKLGLDAFYEHFKNLANDIENGNEHSNSENDCDCECTLFDELDCDITCDEIKECIKKLKRNKACSEDCILNEFFIEFADTLLPCLCKLFNSIFRSGYFPQSWSQGSIVPVYKKGDQNDTNNYRGITLLSCLGKLFTSILNSRLLKWDSENNVITDAQFGFKQDFSTVDAIFVLQSIINRNLSKKGGRLYCCFIDYKKAFDLIDRSKLWCKLIKQGIQGKMLKIIKSLYENVKSCIKYNGCLSQYFRNSVGLFQGEVLLPILYSLYVNDCEMHFIRSNCPSVEINMNNIFLLMYADDTVLLAETPQDLQTLLNSLYTYCDEWKLTVNTAKTKIMVFRNGGYIRQDEKWFYNGNELEIVNEFNYLGILFNSNGKFTVT